VGAASNAELSADVADVGFGGVGSYAELFGNEFVVMAFKDVSGDEELALGQSGDTFDKQPLFCVHQHGGIIEKK
jgi:hypothetical protein